MDREALEAMQARFEDRTYLKTGVFERPTMSDMAGLIRAIRAAPVLLDTVRLRKLAKLALSHAADDDLWSANLIAQTIDAIVGCEGCATPALEPAAAPAVGETYEKAVAISEARGNARFPDDGDKADAYAEGLRVGRSEALSTPAPAAGLVTAETVEAALKAERIAIGERLRQTASHYTPSSDGWNTFLMEAEWVESRTAAALSARQEGGQS